MTVRAARAEDAEAIARVHVETWRAAYAHVFPAERLLALDPEARVPRWREWIADPTTRVVVAERDDGPVGFAYVGPSRDPDAGPDTGELYAIYVLPEAWGGGAGPALMDAALAALRELGFARATLWVLGDNPRARRFYERTGWRLDEGAARDAVFFDVGVTEVRYRHNLG